MKYWLDLLPVSVVKILVITLVSGCMMDWLFIYLREQQASDHWLELSIGFGYLFVWQLLVYFLLGLKAKPAIKLLFSDGKKGSDWTWLESGYYWIMFLSFYFFFTYKIGYFVFVSVAFCLPDIYIKRSILFPPSAEAKDHH